MRFGVLDPGHIVEGAPNQPLWKEGKTNCNILSHCEQEPPLCALKGIRRGTVVILAFSARESKSSHAPLEIIDYQLADRALKAEVER